MFLVLLLCVASASPVELENLCSNETFSYNGVLVNSFQKIRRSLEFKSLSHYLISNIVTCDPAEFKDKRNLWDSIKIKNA